MIIRGRWLLAWVCGLAAACSEDARPDANTSATSATSAPSTTGVESGGSDESSGVAGTSGSDAGTGAGSSSGGSLTTGPDDGSSTGEDPSATLDLDSVGSLVVMGDSIGDGGGQAPFYYELLRGSFEAKYGAIEYRNVADSGSETDALLGQANALPAALPGPVVVMVTSGGNDMKSSIAAIIGGADGPARETMQANIDEALGVLTAPGRFGPGVEVFVLEANIYDSSDGEGNFGQNDCAFGGGLPAIMTDGFFAAWNGAIEEVVTEHGQTLLDMHGHFYGHGFNGTDNWYASDCTHPNATGHDELHRFVYRTVTGEEL
jgi:lysophospholipase L1-like esterase